MGHIVELTNYDEIAEIYISDVESERSWNNLYERPSLIKMFDDFESKDIVDVGCGTGFYASYALERGARVTAVDASEKMLDHVRSRYMTSNLRLVKADLLNGLPFLESNSQDYIVSSLVMHYIADWSLLLSDFFRVLRPNGKVYISTHHPFADFLVLNKKSYFDFQLIETTWGKDQKPYKVHYYTRNLSDVITPILSSKLKLIELVEPLPDGRCRDLAPSVYEKLSTKPAILFLKLQK